MITVTTVRMTTWACPTQLEGTVDDGRAIYASYRWGCLRIDVGNKDTDLYDWPTVFTDDTDGGLDGVITYEEIVRRTAGHITWPEHCEDASTEPSSHGV